MYICFFKCLVIRSLEYYSGLFWSASVQVLPYARPRSKLTGYFDFKTKSAPWAMGREGLEKTPPLGWIGSGSLRFPVKLSSLNFQTWDLHPLVPSRPPLFFTGIHGLYFITHFLFFLSQSLPLWVLDGLVFSLFFSYFGKHTLWIYVLYQRIFKSCHFVDIVISSFTFTWL